MRTIALVVLLIACLLPGLPPAALGQSEGSVDNRDFPIKPGSHLEFPVYYATDRFREFHKGRPVFTTKRRYAAGIEYGVCQASVPVEGMKALPKSLVLAGWRQKPGVIKKPSVSDPDDFTNPNDFFDELRRVRERSGMEDVVVFVHGYKNTFDSAASSAAKIAYWFKCPTIVYSWPCAEKYTGYSADENNAEWSLPHFRKLITDLEDKVTAPHIYIVAHSMGNRLATWMLQHRAEHAQCDPTKDLPRFKAVVLSSPDIDSGTFKNTAELIARNTPRTYVLVSVADKAMFASKFVHKKGRAGMLGPDGLGLGKSGTDGVDTDWRQPLRIKGLDTVEFTELDLGLFGHSIPASLISGLAKYGSAGPNLELKPEEIRGYKWLRVVRTGSK